MMKQRKFYIDFFFLFKKIRDTKKAQTPITFKYWFIQKILRFNPGAYWPMHFSSLVICPDNVVLGVDTNPGYMPGCYIQAAEKIEIGDYTQIAPNVALITSNHDPHQNNIHAEAKSIIIGKYCWIGYGAVILPGVKLGNNTIVGANAVVTKSFEEGYIVLAGNPALPIKNIDKDKCTEFKNAIEYIGYYPK